MPTFALAVAIVATGWWIATTTPGLRFALALARLVVPTLEAEDVNGSLRDGVRIGKLAFSTPDWSIRIDELAAVTDSVLATRHVDVRSASARRVAIDWVIRAEPGPPLTEIGIPVDVSFTDVRIGELALGERGAHPLVFRNIAIAGHADADTYAVDRGELEYGPTHLAFAGRLGGHAPFAIDLSGDARSTVMTHAAAAKIRASGSLTRLELAVDGDSQSTRAKVNAVLALFEAVPVIRLDAAVADFDPAHWFADVPSMRLTGRAELAPAARPEPAGFTTAVAGPFSVDNALAGPINENRVPVRSARGTLHWSSTGLQLALDSVTAVRGTASGSFAWSYGSDEIDARLRVIGIDASTLHTALVATMLDGELEYRFALGVQKFDGRLRNTRGLPLAADFDLTVRERLLTITTARLVLGEGRADATGRIELKDGYATQLRGTVVALNLGQLVRGIDTQINGNFDVDGRLAPPISGRAQLTLTESRIAGRPLAGRATATLADKRADLDLDLLSGSARLTAQGGIGGGRELTFELRVPELTQLVPGAGGQLVARGAVSGELAEPRLNLTSTANNLKLPGGHTIIAVDLSLAGGTAPKEPLAVMVKVDGHRKGESPLAIETASLVARGVTSDHQIELTGAMRSKQTFRAVAVGGWNDRAWRGALNGAEAGQPLNLLSTKPVPLVIGATTLSIGPADFELANAHYMAVEVQRGDGRWRTVGSVEGLQPQALDSQARAPRRVVRTNAGDRVPLTLAGRWQLEYTDSVTGIAVIERTGGDLYSGIDGLNPIGVSDVGAALNVVANRVTGNVYLRGRALGKVDAEVDAYIDPALSDGKPLAQSRPFRVIIDATLPDLSWIGPLIGDSVQFGGNATIRTVVSGTPADPTAQGTIKGDALRVAWVDQAVRLEDGRLDAVLEEGVLVVNDLSFVGTPRVAPLDKRALEGLSTGRPHEVRAVGRVALGTLTGSIGVTAQQLPVIQSEDRWMMVSGTGGITLTPQRADLYGKLTVDGAYINFTSLKNQRSLPGDVVVVRKEKPAPPPAGPPIDIVLDVQGSLGERFYLEGAGLNARLAGQVLVTGRPGQLRATGSVRAVDGIYNGYGQRLQIDRGIVTFQGPIDNPALNVLAVRSGLPVEVGVAIGGTAQRPVIRLHSDPSMSDAEKLNWLVLGRPPGPNDGQDRALLSAAASALFSGQGDGASANLMRSLGIDQVTIRPGQDSTSLLPRETVAGKLRSSSSTAVTDFVAIGKRINDDLYMSFEQAISGAEYFVAFNYRLTNRLSLIARAGSTNALDLVYSFAFE